MSAQVAEPKTRREAREQAEAETSAEGLQMSFLDHLDELRKRLIYAVLSIGICFILAFTFSGYIFEFLEKPIVVQLHKQQKLMQAAYGRVDPGQVAEGATVQYTFTEETTVGGAKVPLGTTIKMKRITLGGAPALVLAEPWVVARTVLPADTPLTQIFHEGDKMLTSVRTEDDRLIVRGVTSPFMVFVQIALYAGIALAIPFLFYQVWAFIAPGLYHHEKKYIVPVLTMATVFFIIGATFAYKVAFPAACDYLLTLATESGLRTLLDAEDYLSLIIMIMLGLGLVFQIPVIAFVLGRIGLINAKMMLKVWRYAIVVNAILAAVLTPTPDAYNMTMFMLPMLGLYFLSIIIVWIFGKKRKTDAQVEAESHG